jgi:hypothetical protein
MSIEIKRKASAAAPSNTTSAPFLALPCPCYTYSQSRKVWLCWVSRRISLRAQTKCVGERRPGQLAPPSSASTQPHHLHTHHPNDFDDITHHHARRIHLNHPRPFYFRHGRPRAALRPVHPFRRRRPAGRPRPEWQHAHCRSPGGTSTPPSSAVCAVHVRRVQCCRAVVVEELALTSSKPGLSPAPTTTWHFARLRRHVVSQTCRIVDMPYT